jgi:Flp pilus assembly protein TadD
VLLALLTAAAYVPALRAGFIWDDDDYVTANRMLRSAAGLWRIWSEPGAVPQYYPLTFTTFWLESHAWGFNAAGYHAVNVALHALSAVLLWRVLSFLRVPGAWLAAAIFAVHPVEVESVAWITERKNTLSGTCYLGALLSYLHFACGRGRRRGRFYALALVLFAAALLSKTVAASLPAVLAVILWWKRDRLDAAALAPLVPMFALGLAAGSVTAWLEKTYVGAVGADWNLSLIERGLIAGRALWFYAASIIWPHPLVFFYPRWRIDAGIWWQYAYPVAAALVVACLYGWRKRIGKGPLAAVLCFVLILVPALGFVDVFPMRYSFVADHFQYLGSIACIALVAALVWRIPVVPRTVISVVALALLSVLTWFRAGEFRDQETLWRATIEKNPAAWMAHNNLGLQLFARGRAEEAMAHYRAALAVKPDDAFAANNLGRALAAAGNLDEAVAEFHRALASEPQNAEARTNLGNALAAQGHLSEAAAEYRIALEVRPRYADAHNNLANVLAMLGRTDEAIAHYRAALAIDPEYRDARDNLALIESGRGVQAPQ